MPAGYVKLATGEVFIGEVIGRREPLVGEVVFNTSMTGYQQILADPSYAGQIVTFTYPVIGHHGFQLVEGENLRPYAAGLIVSELYDAASPDGGESSIDQILQKRGMTALVGVDTRALVHSIRRYGTVTGVIACGSPADMMEFPALPPFTSPEWVESVSTKEMQTYPNDGPHIVVVDLGMKRSILKHLLAARCQVTVVPFSTGAEEIIALKPDGVLYSNGPGDPTALKPWLQEVKRVSQTTPTLGIGLGHLLIALAYGAETTKLKFGHRGNHPVKELSTGRVLITPQHHSYVVVEESIDQDQFAVAFRHVHDGTVEGLVHKERPIYTVQFHPEDYPGPSDTAHIFHRFIECTQKGGQKAYAFV